MEKYLILNDLKRFIYTLLENKKTMLIFLGLGASLGLILAFTISPMYQSKGVYEVTLEDLEQKSQVANFQQDLFNPFGASGDPRAYKVIEILNSRKFALNLIDKYKLKRDLFAFKSYNKETGKVSYSNIVDDDGNWIKGKEPNDEATFQLFKVYYDVNYDIETGFIHISAISYSQYKARELVELLAYEVNELLREIDLLDAEAAIVYYNKQISLSLSEDLIVAISRLLESEIRKKMLANVKQNYALNPIDPPYFPDIKFSPSRFLILIVSMFLFFIFGVAKIYYSKIKARFDDLFKKPDAG